VVSFGWRRGFDCMFYVWNQHFLVKYGSPTVRCNWSDSENGETWLSLLSLFGWIFSHYDVKMFHFFCASVCDEKPMSMRLCTTFNIKAWILLTLGWRT
jgi:hypothetical protein